SRSATRVPCRVCHLEGKGVNYSRCLREGVGMVTDGQFEHAAYIFSPDASYGLVSDLRHSGLPSGVHFVASVPGPWQIVAIGDFDIFACVAGVDVDAVKAKIFQLRGNGAIVSTLTLWIIDYVSADIDAPKAFRRGVRKG